MARLDGLDFARFIAFVGMVIVNFKVVMGVDEKSADIFSLMLNGLNGRAAATFVVLAGIGLGLAAQKHGYSKLLGVNLKRALVLLVIGLLNALVFEADILHYYAFYFLIGIFCVRLGARNLIGLMLLVNVMFFIMLIGFDYDARRDWDTLSYTGFWTLQGFVTNLFYNGWHPVFPWVSFFIFGIWLSRQKLGQTSIQTHMIVLGGLVFIVNQLVSWGMMNLIAPFDAEATLLFGNAPVPPTFLYVIAGMSAATLVTGLCLRLTSFLTKVGLLELIRPAGRQTLTLYIAHIFIGMGIIEALGLTMNTPILAAFGAAMLFSMVAVIYAFIWAKFFKLGPLESLMHRLAG